MLTFSGRGAVLGSSSLPFSSLTLSFSATPSLPLMDEGYNNQRQNCCRLWVPQYQGSGLLSADESLLTRCRLDCLTAQSEFGNWQTEELLRAYGTLFHLTQSHKKALNLGVFLAELSVTDQWLEEGRITPDVDDSVAALAM